jgi:hypothetical protein
VEEGSLTLSGGVVLQSGTLAVAEGTTLAATGGLDNRGRVQGEGTVAVQTLDNHGVVSPGSSPGTLAIAGSFAQWADGTLDIELGSLADFDLLTVSGSASLGGTLEVRPFGDYVPEIGDSFVILRSAGALSGIFANEHIGVGAYADGVDFDVLYDYNLGTVTLQVAHVVTAVPEPQGWALLMAGLGAVAWALRRRALREAKGFVVR